MNFHKFYLLNPYNIFIKENKFQIDKWITIYEEIDTCETSHIFRNWLFIDMHEFKQEILNHCCKWGNTFKKYLIDYIIFSLNVSLQFIVILLLFIFVVYVSTIVYFNLILIY